MLSEFIIMSKSEKSNRDRSIDAIKKSLESNLEPNKDGSPKVIGKPGPTAKDLRETIEATRNIMNATNSDWD